MPTPLTPHDAALIAAQVRQSATGTKQDVIALLTMYAAHEHEWTDEERQFVYRAVSATILFWADLSFDEIEEIATVCRRMDGSTMPPTQFSAN